ncbi:Hypp4518 [Branchiostoma lanceolatum]|uniref:Hypp4518 protein n=1 Tax=Branchiostoma lanceolatum TaxID=7740 RepID=A0A8K0F1A4_BRALA|nr:Hypp4518 [Branchiostoma lanceolatum]
MSGHQRHPPTDTPMDLQPDLHSDISSHSAEAGRSAHGEHTDRRQQEDGAPEARNRLSAQADTHKTGDISAGRHPCDDDQQTADSHRSTPPRNAS